MSAHTPGPWVVNYQTVVETEDEKQICTIIANVNDHHVGYEAAKANAKLVAAAPDLLQALEELVEVDSSIARTQLGAAKANTKSNVLQVVRAKRAIAKAKGLS